MFTADDDRHHPGFGHFHLNERDEHGRRQQLVRERVHHLAQRGDLLAAPGQVAVQPVGQRCQPEDGCRHEVLVDPQHLPALELRQQHHDEQRHQEDPRQRQRVRQIHRQEPDRRVIGRHCIPPPAGAQNALAGTRVGI
jgi:hypothetical protein